MHGIQPVKETITGEYIFEEIEQYQNVVLVLMNFMGFLQTENLRCLEARVT